jgi:polynucleotide 5'-hydroxyl-kinase GRC3/NOL9
MIKKIYTLFSSYFFVSLILKIITFFNKLQLLETVLVKGPLLLKVKGECEILGVKFRNTFIVYNNNTYLPIEKNKDAVITIKKGSDCIDLKNTALDKDHIGTRIWNNIIDLIVKTKRKRIIIIGSSDTGKSTLTLFIANKLINKGLKPVIIDSDIGQGELSPPACIGAAILPEQTIDLAKCIPNCINFIGNIQPIGYENRITNCIIRIQDILSTKERIILINTDGYFINNEKNYKIELIEKINPDCIICMRESDQSIDIFEIIKERFSKNQNIQILQGQSIQKEIRKSLYDRRKKRIIRYSKLYKTFTKNVIISKQKLNTLYYKDKFFLLKKIQYIDNINRIETNSESIEDFLNDKSFIRNRFVGLSLKEDYEKIIGFGIIKNYNNGFFLIRSSVYKFDHIFISDIKLYFNRNTISHNNVIF